jgi:hypothetical protein
MSAEYQTLFNIIIAICSFLAGGIMKVMWDSLQDLRRADKELADKVASIEILVAGQYVKVDRFEAIIKALFDKLDKIHEILGQKQDRH